MPWKVSAHDQCPAAKPHGVVRETDGRLEACHATEAEAKAHMKALYANEPTMKVCKVDEEEQLVFGWASVSADESGRMVVDHDGEVIEPAELEEAAYDFVLEAREAGQMHKGDSIGRMVESLVMTPEKAAAMGLDVPPLNGWWVGMKIDDADAFEKIKNGTYSMFSIQGTCEPEEVEVA